VQTWCGTAPKTAAIGPGYSGEPSVVIPATASPRASRVERNRRKNAVMSVWVGSWSRTRQEIRLKVRLSTIERMQNGPSYSSSTAR
jgi:hypothetical protein